MRRSSAAFMMLALAAAGCAAREGPAAGEETRARQASETPRGFPIGAARLPEIGEDSGLEDYLARAALNNPGLRAGIMPYPFSLKITVFRGLNFQEPETVEIKLY